MDIPWMEQRLLEYLDACDRYEAADKRAAGDYYSAEMRTIDHEAQQKQATVERILATLDPALVDELLPLGYTSSNIARRIRKALGILGDRAEWAVRLAPDGPQISADALHPLIWSAASTIWPTGEFRVAVGQAATALSSLVKSKAGSSLRDRELVTQVFSPDGPKLGQPRLHLPGREADPKTWSSRQQGLHHLAQGAFAGIRNVSAHDDEPWTEQVALEQLAVLSVVARWTDEAELLRAD